MPPKYKIGQRVMCADQKCQVFATKLEPYKPALDPFGRSEVYPKLDYLLYILKTLEPLTYEGTLDVAEHAIEDEEWF